MKDRKQRQEAKKSNSDKLTKREWLKSWSPGRAPLTVRRTTQQQPKKSYKKKSKIKNVNNHRLDTHQDRQNFPLDKKNGNEKEKRRKKKRNTTKQDHIRSSHRSLR